MNTYYVIVEARDRASHWDGESWSPASDEAAVYGSEAEAAAAGRRECGARDWVVVQVEDDDAEAIVEYAERLREERAIEERARGE